MKECTSCKEIKPFTDFYNSKSYAGGYGYRCKSCDNIAGKAYRELHKERHSKLNAIRGRRHKYGLEPEEFEDLIKNGCQICGNYTQKMCVDHCHTTGKVRGGLCTRCNAGLGQFLDNTTYLINAVKYLQQFQINQEETQCH